MGRSDSPLRDRVIFVDGAPRSGTTWLVTLLATHPEIAGVGAESHLFDFGLTNLFDAHENKNPKVGGLASYVHRDELADLVRDFCDGVLMRMRSHVSAGGPEPPFVVEKTPVQSVLGGSDLARKAECYPDAWYVHIVRDREAVAKSLMRAPWMEDRSYATCSGIWDRAVGYARETLGDLPHYREVSYEELREDPGVACREIFEWIGVDAGENVLELMRRLSREPFSDLGALPAATDGGGRHAARRLKAGARAVRNRLRNAAPAAADGEPDPGLALSFNFVRAMRERDEATLRSLMSPKLELLFRKPDGDLSLRGDDARDALVQIANETFNRTYVGESWTASGGPGEWWTNAPDWPLRTMLFGGLGGDATRVDLAIGLVLNDEHQVRRALVISAGALDGRPVAP